jgi:hypothetical protein
MASDTVQYEDRLMVTTKEPVIRQPPAKVVYQGVKETSDSTTAEPVKANLKVSWWDSFLARKAPSLVSNLETKQETHKTKTFLESKTRMEKLLKDVQGFVKTSFEDYKEKIVHLDRQTARMNELFKKGVVDERTGEYLWDEYGMKGSYRIAVLELDKVVREHAEAERVYYTYVAHEQSIKKALHLIRSSSSETDEVNKIFSDLVMSLKKFNIDNVDALNANTTENAQDAVDILQELSAEGPSLSESIQAPHSVTPGLNPETASILNRCKARAHITKKQDVISSLSIPNT